MSVPFGRAVLTLDDITKQIRRTFEQFTDLRRGKNTRYTLVDAGLSTFSVFFMQSVVFGIPAQPGLAAGQEQRPAAGWGPSDPVGQSDPPPARRH